jgi:hypothetical protein
VLVRGRAGADSDVPLVFASRHGDVARSMDLLGALVSDQPLSPTGFGLSVHNAIAALYSIARGHRGNLWHWLPAGPVEAACLGGRRPAGRWRPRCGWWSESPLPEIRDVRRRTRPVLCLVLAFDRADSGPADARCGGSRRRPGHRARHAAACAGPAPLPVVRRAALEHVAHGQRWRWGRRG